MPPAAHGVHRVDERPPPAHPFPSAPRHVLVVYAGAVAAPYDIASLIGADPFACGLTTPVQTSNGPGCPDPA